MFHFLIFENSWQNKKIKQFDNYNQRDKFNFNDP
jgi:hypothetical protein